VLAARTGEDGHKNKHQDQDVPMHGEEMSKLQGLGEVGQEAEQAQDEDKDDVDRAAKKRK